MSRPLRSKRNFKSLQLDVSKPPSPAEPDPVPTRLAPASKQAPGGAKKRPPPMNLKPKVAADIPPASESSAVDGFVAVAPVPSTAPASGTSASAKRMTYHTTLSDTLASLDLNAEVKYDLRDEDLKDLHELGQGNGGSVKKVEHVPSRTIMAKKVCLSLGASPTWPSPSPLGRLPKSGRLSSLMQNRPSGNKFCASYRSCTTVTRNISFPSTARFCLTRTSVFAWSSWTRVLSMGFINK